MTDVLWTDAQSSCGRGGAAALVLLADADSFARGGAIRSPAAWLRAMTARAVRERLPLHGNFARLLRRSDGVEPVSARPANPSFLNDP